MKKHLTGKLFLSSLLLVGLVSCGNKQTTPTLESISVSTGLQAYSVGYKMDKADFNVVATYSDKTTATVASKDFTVDVNLPYTFTDEETLTGKDFNITYKEKSAKVHAKVVSNDGKSQITFKNYDGTILQNERVTKGENIIYRGDLPKKPVQGTEALNVFTGWDKELGEVKENTVFVAQYKAIDKYIDNDHDGLPVGVDTNDNDNHFDVGAKSMVYLETNIDIDFTKFLVDEANTKYDNDLAKLGLFMSNPKIDFKDGLFTDRICGGRENALYGRLGFDDFHHFDFKDLAAEKYTYDPRDTTSGAYGHKYLRDKDNKVVKDLIFIAFEGTNGKNRWASNFDVGYDDPMYYTKAANSGKGEKGTEADHPEWTDKRFHKGFYTAASRVINEKVDGPAPKQGEADTRKDGPVKFLKYIEDHTTEGLGKPIVFVTGHSRGGAMANIVGEYLENEYKDGDGESKVIPFTYAFAAPSVWGDSSKMTLRTVFNVLNKDDLVTKVPFSEWGFSKLGDTVIDISVGENYKTLYDQNRDKREYQFIKGDVTESIFHNLGCMGRNNIYNIDNNDDKYLSNTALNETSLDTEDAANAEIAKLNAYYKENLGDFFNYFSLKAVEEYDYVAGKNVYNIYANCCLGAVTDLVGRLMTSDAKVMDHLDDVLPLLMNSKFMELVGDLLVQIFPEGPDKIALPHDYGAYHILLREYKEGK